MQLTIDVPDDSPLATEVQSWADGGSYDLKVRQTSMGMFELLEAEASEPDEEANNEGDMPAEDGMRGKNPAMVVMIGKVRGGKEK